VLFLNPHTGVYQLSRDQRNVYYHALKDCVYTQFNNFDASVHVKIGQSTKNGLSDVHVQHLSQEFHLYL